MCNISGFPAGPVKGFSLSWLLEHPVSQGQSHRIEPGVHDLSHRLGLRERARAMAGRVGKALEAMDRPCCLDIPKIET